MMTFGGLIAAYIVIATNNVAEWKPFDLPIQVWISTAIIVASSFTYEFGKRAIARNDQPTAKKWLLATTVLGAAFISSQILVWIALTKRGLYMQGNPYAGFFYLLTAIHAVHVLGGISALGSVLLRSWYPTTNPDAVGKRTALAQVVGWYWHFMGALWLALFLLLGFLEITLKIWICCKSSRILTPALNALSSVFLLSGFYFIMKTRVAEHRLCMLAASSVSALFLVCYITHHALRTYYFGLGPTKFTGEGIIRPIYFTILTSHTILAACIAPFVIVTLRRGLKGRYDSHKTRAARFSDLALCLDHRASSFICFYTSFTPADNIWRFLNFFRNFGV